jgi:hypothetical protein
MTKKQTNILQQIQDIFNTCQIWTRISAFDEKKEEFEKMAADAGFDNAHVVDYWNRRAFYSLSTRLDNLQHARDLGITQF